MTNEFRIYCDEIPRSNRGMTQGLEILEFLAQGYVRLAAVMLPALDY